jgi:hypothetical protein
MLSADFATYACGSRRLLDFTEANEQLLLLVEVRRTMDALAAAAPARIAKGSLTEEDQSKAELFLWLAIANDLEAGEAWLAEYRTLPSGCDLPRWSVADRIKARGDGYSWTAKVEALRTEIRRRREIYAGDVDKGRLTADQAQQQLERLEAVHDLYWRQGYAFDGTRDELRAYSAIILDHDVAEQGAAKVQSCGDSSRVEHSANQPTVAGSNPAPRSNFVGATT